LSRPDLFVVCKNCGAEISPYVTECPYCGRRVRKRAPRVEIARDGEPRARERRMSRARPRRPRLPARSASERRPFVSGAVFVLSALLTFAAEIGVSLDELGALIPGQFEQPWRLLTAPLVHTSVAYLAIAAGIATAALRALELRFGSVAALLAYLGCAVPASAVALAAGRSGLPFADAVAVVAGANGLAMGLLVAYVVERRLAAPGALAAAVDPLALAVAAVLILALPLAVPEASAAAAAGGIAGGVAVGLVLSLWRRRRGPLIDAGI